MQISDQISLNVFEKIKNKLNNYYPRDKKSLMGQPILYNNDANNLIKNAFSMNESFMLSRLGTTETEVIKHFLFNKNKFPDYLLKKINMLSGVFPPNQKILTQFAETYIDALQHIDILGVRSSKSEYYFLWENEKKVLKKTLKKKVHFLDLESIDPFFFEDPWTKYLSGKKVLIIHPFKSTIESQLQKIGIHEHNKNFLPAFNYELIQTIQSLDSSYNANYTDWFEALDFMSSQIRKKDFDIALIAGGAYGLPLAKVCKHLNKQVMHIGGSLQLYFGILGRRWEGNETNFSVMFNSKWVRPHKNETPINKHKIENSCYW